MKKKWSTAKFECIHRNIEAGIMLRNDCKKWQAGAPQYINGPVTSPGDQYCDAGSVAQSCPFCSSQNPYS